ncbi:MAG: NAD-dependent epimerase/dehydratase family protein [Planctomycetota bacterium]
MTSAATNPTQAPAASPAQAAGSAVSRQRAILITGAGGEVGHGLIHALSEAGGTPIVALDLRPLDEDLAQRCAETVVADIRDPLALLPVVSRYEIAEVFHLAALLSTTSERNPVLAQQVNVRGTMHVLRVAAEQGRARGTPVRVVYPSSIAVYGLPSAEAKAAAGAVREDEHLTPITMYGVNKLACEQLGRYFGEHYKLLDDQPPPIDFRCIRYPGLISPHTAPSGGTSDYGPLMLHAAARGEEAACFVPGEARLPFMLMRDAIDATLALARAEEPPAGPRGRVYNVASFAPTAAEMFEAIKVHFPNARLRYDIEPKRARIVESWPADVDRSAAERHLGVPAGRPFAEALADELAPAVRSMYVS